MIDIDALLLGEHTLQGVWPDAKHPFKTNGQAFGIVLDGNLFLFLEDDNDDYRSELGVVMFAQGNAYHGYTSIGRAVVVSIATEREHAGQNKVYEFKDVETGVVGLSIGTDNIDDYYPSFVVEYNAAAWGTR